MIDISHSDQARDALGEEAFVKLRSRFVSEVDEFQNWLESGEAHDFLEISARAHKVAGSAAVFGAGPLGKTLKQIETAAKVGNVDDIRDCAVRFAASWIQTKAQLSQ